MERKESKPGLFSRVFTRKGASVFSAAGPIPAASAVGSAASAALLGSNNSAATSENLKKASIEFNDYLKEIDRADLEERSHSVLKMTRWLEKQQAYSNSAFQPSHLRDFTMIPTESLLVDLAAYCACSLSSSPPTSTPKGFEIAETRRIEAPTFGSSIKPTTIQSCKPLGDIAGDTDLVVVAIRGSASIHDWMVNFNHGTEANTPIEDEFLGLSTSGTPYHAHAGFLEASKEMLPLIATHLSKTLHAYGNSQSSARPRLLFAGHSAGGAVAAMLYTHIMKEAILPSGDALIDLKARFTSIHCITFGAPPITTSHIPPPGSRDSSIFFSFINEGDPIPRADSPYIDSLLRINATKMPLEAIQWKLPARKLFNAGTVILIPKQGRQSGGLKLPNEEGEGSLQETIMGNLSCHRMRFYFEELSA